MAPSAAGRCGPKGGELWPWPDAAGDGEWLRAFGDDAKHRAEASAGDDIQASANDRGAWCRVVERDKYGGMNRRLGIGGSEAA